MNLKRYIGTVMAISMVTSSTIQAAEITKTNFNTVVSDTSNYTTSEKNDSTKDIDEEIKANTYNKDSENYTEITDKDLFDNNMNESEEEYDNTLEEEVKQVDKTELQELYDKNKDINSSLYTSPSWQEFDEAIKHVEAVLNDENACQSKVTSAKENLESAIRNLKSLVNKKELERLINKSSYYVKNIYVYTTSTGDFFDKALQDAKNVLKNNNAVQSEVDEAKINLENAINGLVKRGNKTSLSKLYDSGKDKDLSIYPSSTWAIFEKAMENAKAILDDKDALQSDIDVAEGNLKNAMNILFEKGNKTSLRNLYNKINEMDVVGDSNSIAVAMNAAKAVLDNEDAIQIDIDTAANNLENAMNEIAPFARKTELRDAYRNSNVKYPEMYTSSTWSNLELALSKAEEVLNNEDATQSEIDEAKNNLVNARKMLTKKDYKGSLERLYNNNKDKVCAVYEVSGWTIFNEALKAAKDVLDNENALQGEVDVAENNLKDAIKNLVCVVNKAELKDLYNNYAKEIITLGYTNSKKTAFAKAEVAAKNILADDNAIQSEVDIAKDNLEKAINLLKEEDNKSLLNKLYDEGTCRTSSVYTSSSWTNFENAMENAKIALDNETASKEEQDKAANDLEYAIKNLVSVVDKSELKALYDSKKGLPGFLYSKNSWVNFNKVLDYASVVLDDENATQMEVDTVKNNLEKAVSELV